MASKKKAAIIPNSGPSVKRATVEDAERTSLVEDWSVDAEQLVALGASIEELPAVLQLAEDYMPAFSLLGADRAQVVLQKLLTKVQTLIETGASTRSIAEQLMDDPELTDLYEAMDRMNRRSHPS